MPAGAGRNCAPTNPADCMPEAVKRREEQPGSVPGSISAADISSALIRLLYLFSGPLEREGGFLECCIAVGALLGVTVVVDYVDVANDPAQDMAEQSYFEAIKARIEEGWYDGALASPPFCTFSRARGRP